MSAVKIATKPLQILSFAMAMVKQRVIAKAYPQTPFPNFEEFVGKIRRQKEHSIYASASELYYAAFFGRDSIEAAEDLLRKDPTFARELIPLLASHQGVRFDLLTEEEPGRIHHEYRMSPTMYFETTGEMLPLKVANIYRTLAEQWGGDERELTYYGSVDATPLYIKLVTDYLEKTQDTSLLDEVFIDKLGQEKTIRQSVLDALDWLVNRITQGPRENILSLIKPSYPEKRLPLLEFQPYTEKGIPNQMWKDSQTAIIHKNGILPNRKYPIATIELQGHAYDALVKSARIFQGVFQEKAHIWKLIAANIQKIVLEKFWIPEEKYFGQALDHDIKGYYQLVQTPTSDATELLNTELFDTISNKDMYVEAIINTVYDKNFMTSVGIRCRSLSYDSLVDFWDYHGSRAVWIKATYDFAKGLRRQGFYQLAEQLEIRIMNGVRISGTFAELFYVAPDGRVVYDPSGKRKTKQYEEIAATTIPEALQTWTASAIAAIEYDATFPFVRKKQTPSQKKFEENIVQKVPILSLITSPRKAYKALPKDYGYKINIEKGHASEESFKRIHQS